MKFIIITLYTNDGDIWGIYTKDHVNRQEFLTAIRADDGLSTELDAMEDNPDALTEDDVQHAYMCQTPNDFVDGDVWDWCDPEDDGAVAITAIGSRG